MKLPNRKVNIHFTLEWSEGVITIFHLKFGNKPADLSKPKGNKIEDVVKEITCTDRVNVDLKIYGPPNATWTLEVLVAYLNDDGTEKEEKYPLHKKIIKGDFLKKGKYRWPYAYKISKTPKKD